MFSYNEQLLYVRRSVSKGYIEKFLSIGMPIHLAIQRGLEEHVTQLLEELKEYNKHSIIRSRL